jgi:hypothetical protein
MTSTGNDPELERYPVRGPSGPSTLRRSICGLRKLAGSLLTR